MTKQRASSAEKSAIGERDHIDASLPSAHGHHAPKSYSSATNCRKSRSGWEALQHLRAVALLNVISSTSLLTGAEMHPDPVAAFAIDTGSALAFGLWAYLNATTHASILLPTQELFATAFDPETGFQIRAGRAQALDRTALENSALWSAIDFNLPHPLVDFRFLIAAPRAQVLSPEIF